MGCNFAMGFSYKAACKSRGFKPESVRDLSAIGAFLKNFKQEEYYGAFRDFNFLVALATNDTLPIKVILFKHNSSFQMITWQLRDSQNKIFNGEFQAPS